MTASPTQPLASADATAHLAALPARPQEQLLMDLLPELNGPRVLCTSAGLAQFARAAGRRFPTASIECVYLDVYHANLARQALEGELAHVSISCRADFPTAEYDLAALPLSAHGEGELAREWLQEAFDRLRLGGQLVASTERTSDTWLGEQMARLSGKVERRALPLGAVYLTTKTAPLKKRKQFDCTFAMRDRGRLLQVYSRPGVFSHRRVDPGARQVLGALELEAGQRVLDLGAGSGVLSLAAACRAENVVVQALDANARAVQCVARGAELNGLSDITCTLTSLENFTPPGVFDVALANPPYFARFEIARRFLEAGHAALAPGGQILLVTKMAEWYAQHMGQWFTDVSITATKGYFIVRGTRAQAA